jgi:aspartate/methionine/tyrosine aminotransferase
MAPAPVDGGVVRPGRRAAGIAPFQVMRILERAKALEEAGRDIVHMEIGEPRFPMPEPLLAAARRALDAESMGYTPTAGLPALRRAIAAHYSERYRVAVDPGRIIVTTGGSAALQLALAAILDVGDGVMVSEPGYPCHRHMAAVVGGRVHALSLAAADGWRPTPEQVAAQWQPGTRALLLTTPGNPTGAVIDGDALTSIHSVVRQRRALLIVDETYQGLVYDAEDATALVYGEDGVFVVNSFSKFFGLTGWRLGWLVVPGAWAGVVERLAQNLYLAPPTLAQHVALAAFAPTTMRLLDGRRVLLRERRDLLLDALPGLGLTLAGRPEGAFYVFARLPEEHADAVAFAADLLEVAGVAVTPGTDFGGGDAGRMVRFAYTDEPSRLRSGIERLARFVAVSRRH